MTRIILYDSARPPSKPHPDPIKRLEGQLAKRFREYLIKELPIPAEAPEEPRMPSPPRLVPSLKPVAVGTPLAGMIHHVYIFDEHDGIVVNEEFWQIPVDEKQITEFAQRIKAVRDTLIEESNTTKLIGKPLEKGQAILIADNLADDDTLREKLDYVTNEYLRVISNEVEYSDFIKKIDIYVTIVLPRISIIGYSGVGKDDILALFYGRTTPPEHDPTIAIGVDQIAGARIGTLLITAWDFTGQDRFRKLWELYFRGSAAIIIVTDSTIENVLNSKNIIDLIRRKDITAGVLAIANKQEKPNALTPQLIEHILGIKTIGLTEPQVKSGDPTIALKILSEAMKLAKEPEPKYTGPKPELVFD